MSKMQDSLMIQSIFTHNLRRYILFSFNNTKYEYLYVYHMKKQIRSLFYGENFQVLISKLLKDTKTDCIECELGSKIIGGVSYDHDQQIINNMSLEECNTILAKLKVELNRAFDIVIPF